MTWKYHVPAIAANANMSTPATIFGRRCRVPDRSACAALSTETLRSSGCVGAKARASFAPPLGVKVMAGSGLAVGAVTRTNAGDPRCGGGAPEKMTPVGEVG
ncbi:hypothetical protein NOK12_20640 [Nocardioides sp. OK12]|nr:hypothetical protein NOK12_20640 [Nocardioides sp. OK12]